MRSVIHLQFGKLVPSTLASDMSRARTGEWERPSSSGICSATSAIDSQDHLKVPMRFLGQSVIQICAQGFQVLFP